MNLGIAINLPHTSPEEWASAHQALGLRSVVFPCTYRDSTEKIDAYLRAAKYAELQIAEVGAWSNPMSPDKAVAEKALLHCQHSLELAEYIEACCCVNISGAVGEIWDGGYAENYTAETYEKIVKTTQEIIDAVHPVHTKYALEPMPNMLPDSPDNYLQLIHDINREGFGVHMDIVNLINCPSRYFGNRAFIDDCFQKLRDYMVSCHLKDSIMEHKLTLSLAEIQPGEGGIDLAHYIQAADSIRPDLPMIIEHLPSTDCYLRAVAYVQKLFVK